MQESESEHRPIWEEPSRKWRGHYTLLGSPELPEMQFGWLLPKRIRREAYSQNHKYPAQVCRKVTNVVLIRFQPAAFLSPKSTSRPDPRFPLQTRIDRRMSLSLSVSASRTVHLTALQSPLKPYGILAARLRSWSILSRISFCLFSLAPRVFPSLSTIKHLVSKDDCVYSSGQFYKIDVCQTY